MTDIERQELHQDADIIKKDFADVIDYLTSLDGDADNIETTKAKALTIHLITKVMEMLNLLAESKNLYEQIKDAELESFLDEIFDNKSK